MDINYKNIFKSRSNDAGFTLPVVFGLGLFMILVGATMIVRSQGDRITASTQVGTTRALSAAETGITRYQALLNTNRTMAMYPSCTNTSGSCENISWTNGANLPKGTSCTSNTTTTITAAASTNWQYVDSTNATTKQDKGQYRLVSYTYPNPGVTPGTGTLIIEGRVGQADLSGGSSQKDVGTATTRLRVQIPVSPGDVKNIPIPGLWIKTGALSGNQSVKGNLLINDCSLSGITDTSYQELTGGQPYKDPETGQPYKTIQTGLEFPDLPPKPTYAINTLPSGGTLPATGNTATTKTINGQSVQVYEYSATTAVTGSYTIPAGKKVIIYADSSIDANVDHNCTGVANCKDTDVQIFGYASSGSICLNGNQHMYAFIFAPNYSAGMKGGGNSGGFYGSVWAKNIDTACASNSNHVIVYQSASWDSIGITPKYLPPSISSATSWQRQETY